MTRGKEEMEQKLCEAAIDGDVSSLMEIIQKDRLILDRAATGVSTINPLHIAASYGRAEFVEKLLVINEKLIKVLDAHHQTPLHLASAGGHVEVVQQLIKIQPEMCLACDGEGRNPLHVAAMWGKTDVMKILIRQKTSAAVKEVNGDRTILHLCVNSGQIESLKLLLNLFRTPEFVNATDGCGNTVLHAAVWDKDFQVVKFLLESDHIKIHVNATNALDQTPLDMLKSIPANYPYDERMKALLRYEGGRHGYERSNWLTSNRRDALIVVASIIATVAFQAGVTPPGGVWQDSTTDHKAGEAVMAYTNPGTYVHFLRTNTAGFLGALTMIFLLLSEMPFQRLANIMILTAIFFWCIASTVITYLFSITEITPKKNEGLVISIKIAVVIWCSLTGLYPSFLIYRMMANLTRRIRNIRGYRIEEEAIRWVNTIRGQ